MKTPTDTGMLDWYEAQAPEHLTRWVCKRLVGGWVLAPKHPIAANDPPIDIRTAIAAAMEKQPPTTKPGTAYEGE